MAISLSSSAQDAFSTKKLARAVNNNPQNDDSNCGKRVHIKERHALAIAEKAARLTEAICP